MGSRPSEVDITPRCVMLTTMTGLSIHIGLNEVDSRHYQDRNGDPWKGTLRACENDAHAMAELAAELGFRVVPPLLSAAATTDAFTEAMRNASSTLVAGDILWVTYSGHGGQVENTNPDDDESDGLDETWCLFDRQLIDDELYELYRSFVPGIRIVVFSDSCHSGTVTRSPFAPPPDPTWRVKQPPLGVMVGTEEAHAAVYRSVQRPSVDPLPGSVVLLSGCQDHQFSTDGDDNGVFTGSVLHAWKDPNARTSLRALHQAVLGRIPKRYDQTPNYFVIGDDIIGPALVP